MAHHVGQGLNIKADNSILFLRTYSLLELAERR
jgi:hypothetical protein